VFWSVYTPEKLATFDTKTAVQENVIVSDMSMMTAK
jgi:hypothetical protein